MDKFNFMNIVNSILNECCSDEDRNIMAKQMIAIIKSVKNAKNSNKRLGYTGSTQKINKNRG